VATNFLRSDNQTQNQICEGNDVPSESCSFGCVAGKFSVNGRQTGACGPSGKFCNVVGWCPLEKDITPTNTLDAVKSWTVFAKTSVAYPKFGKTLTNAQFGLNNGTNLFTVEDFITKSGNTFDAIKGKGAIIGIGRL